MTQHKHIDRIFEHARQRQPVISIGEVEVLLEYKLAGTGSSGRQQKITFKKTIIMSLFITSIIALIIKLATNDTQVNPRSRIQSVVASKPQRQATENILPTLAPPPALPALIPEIPVIVNGLNLVQATPEMLLKLGVLCSVHGVAVPTSNQGDYFTYSKYGTYIGVEEKLAAELMNQRAWIVTHQYPDSAIPYPILVTDDLGQNWRAYHGLQGTEGDIDKEVHERINTLVPVLVRTSDVYTELDKADKRWRPDVILWYEPTSAFLSCLPQNTSAEILKEAQAIVNEDSAGLQIAADTGSGKAGLKRSYKYFEVWRSDNRIVQQMQVYPNPTEGSFTVSVDLRFARTLKITVVDISGKVVSTLYKDQVQEAGAKEYACDISALVPGLYILLVETDKEERFTQRIIRK